MQPKISCLCLTMASREKDFLPIAVDCFRRQTWENKELVVVTDPLHTLLDYDNTLFDGWNAELQIVETPLKFSIGAKRNLGCVEARGQYIALWDDDDYSVPQRLERQYAALIAKPNAQVTGLERCYVTNEKKDQWWMSWETNLGVDTTMFFRREYWRTHWFLDSQQPDGPYLRAAQQAGVLNVVDDPRLMYFVNHAGNTFDRTAQYSCTSSLYLKDFVWSDGV